MLSIPFLLIHYIVHILFIPVPRYVYTSKRPEYSPAAKTAGKESGNPDSRAGKPSHETKNLHGCFCVTKSLRSWHFLNSNIIKPWRLNVYSKILTLRRVILPNFPVLGRVLFLWWKTVPIFRRQLACDPLKDFWEIFRIAVTHASAHILNIGPWVLQQFFRLLHP